MENPNKEEGATEQKDQYYFTFFKDNPEASHRLHTTNAAGDSARHHIVEA
jgi:hypothetical protein